MSTDANTQPDADTDGDGGVVRQLHVVNTPSQEGLGGSARPGAREAVNTAVNPSVNAEPVTDRADPDVAESAERAASMDWRRWAAAVEGWVRAPNVTVERPPSWQEIGWRARFGNQTATDGWTRTVAVGFAFIVTWPVRVLAFYADWLARTPSRFFVALVLYAALALARPPYLGWLPFPLKGDR